MIDDADMVARMGHFAVAFFGVHLQGREELAGYVSEAFVDRYADLAWGRRWRRGERAGDGNARAMGPLGPRGSVRALRGGQGPRER